MSRYLELGDVLREPETEPLWVINTSSQSELGAAGEVLIAIQGPGNQATIIEVPQSWLPVDLTLQVDRKLILASTEFRRALGKQHIRLITKEYANALNRDKAASKERERLQTRKRNVTEQTSRRLAGTENKEFTSSVEDATINTDDFTPTSEVIKSSTKEYQPGISYSFKAWADKATILPDLEALNELRIRRTFKRKELQFLQTHLEGKPKTQAMIKKLLQK